MIDTEILRCYTTGVPGSEMVLHTCRTCGALVETGVPLDLHMYWHKSLERRLDRKSDRNVVCTW